MCRQVARTAREKSAGLMPNERLPPAPSARPCFFNSRTDRRSTLSSTSSSSLTNEAVLAIFYNHSGIVTKIAIGQIQIRPRQFATHRLRCSVHCHAQAQLLRHGSRRIDSLVNDLPIGHLIGRRSRRSSFARRFAAIGSRHTSVVLLVR